MSKKSTPKGERQPPDPGHGVSMCITCLPELQCEILCEANPGKQIDYCPPSPHGNERTSATQSSLECINTDAIASREANWRRYVSLITTDAEPPRNAEKPLRQLM